MGRLVTLVMLDRLGRLGYIEHERAPQVRQHLGAVAHLIAQADMHTLLITVGVFARLFRSSQASHATPYGRCTGVLIELRRNRSRRVRRYALNPAPAAVAIPSVPTPRRPIDAAPATPRRTAMSTVAPIAAVRFPLPPANVVRPGFAHWERAQEQRRIDRDRLAVPVLREIATVAEVPA